jgi:hypothetical protein
MTSTPLRAQVEQIINALALGAGDLDLFLDEADSCFVGGPDGRGATLVFIENDGVALLTLATVVGHLDLAGREPFMQEALRANLYWRGTNGATLSLGPQDDVLLHRTLDVNELLDLLHLQQALGTLFDTAAAWSRYLDSQQPELPDLT